MRRMGDFSEQDTISRSWVYNDSSIDSYLSE